MTYRQELHRIQQGLAARGYTLYWSANRVYWVESRSKPRIRWTLHYQAGSWHCDHDWLHALCQSYAGRPITILS